MLQSMCERTLMQITNALFASSRMKELSEPPTERDQVCPQLNLLRERSMAADRFANRCHFFQRRRAHKWLMRRYLLCNNDVDQQRNLSSSHKLAAMGQHSGWIDCLRPLSVHRPLGVPLVLGRDVELEAAAHDKDRPAISTRAEMVVREARQNRRDLR